MRYSALCILLLAISEPLFIHAKVVLVVPRQIRRSPAAPWRPPHYKKSSYGANDSHRLASSHAYYNRVNRYYKKPLRPLPYPPGGDDFDRGHEHVNHVHIPYGKEISHGISFGKGYIPYDNVKSSNLPFVHERYANAYTRQPAVLDYPPTGFMSIGQEYAASATVHENPHVDSFFSDIESARSELHGSLKENANKYYNARSIEKDLSLRNQQALNSAVERDTLAKGTEGLPKDIPSSTISVANAPSGIQGAILPAGIPATNIVGNKESIVLRDTVSLDEYHRKLQEITKTWPSMIAGAAPNFAAATTIPVPHQQLHVGFPTTGLSGTGFGGPTGDTGWFYAQSKQGYAVREDHGDPTTHDFRTVPIHPARYQQLPLEVNVGIPIGTGVTPSIHG